MTAPARILLTGVSSFLGCHLAAHFARAGHAVVATLSKPRTAYPPLRRERLDHAAGAGVDLVETDLTDGDAVAALIGSLRPDYCIHHAAWAERYGAMDFDLDAAHRVSIAPLDGLFGALAGVGAKGVVMTGTAAEYAATDRACTEDDAPWPDTPYGLAKLMQTLRARQLAMGHGLPVRVARVFIPFGPFDAPGKLIPSALEALRSGRPIDLSPCTQARDFLHVADLCAGYAALLDDLPRGGFEIFNLCAGRPVVLADLLAELAQTLGAEPNLLRFGAIAIRAGESAICYGDNTKVCGRLDWRPSPLASSLRRYIEGESP